MHCSNFFKSPEKEVPKAPQDRPSASFADMLRAWPWGRRISLK
jgi:hypothetical protein